MKGIKKQGFYVSYNGFSCVNHSCEVLIDTIHDKFGNKSNNLCVKNSSGEPIEFAFTNMLYKKKNFNQGHSENNILTQFISLQHNEPEKLKHFFEDNGFIFTTSGNEYTQYSCADLDAIINRVKFIVELIIELKKESPSTEVLLHNTLYLLLSDQIVICKDCNHESSDESVIYKSKHYELNHYLNKYKDLNTSLNERGYHDTKLIEKYSWVLDDFESSKKEFKDEKKLSIETNYLFNHKVSKDTKIQIKFLHELTKVSDIKLIDIKNGITFEKDTKIIVDCFSKEMNESLYEITKYVIKSELDYELKKIHPNYDIEKLTASWKVPDLLSALYFSIFFLNPDFEIIKKCANPTCSNYYSVLHSNKNKKYCSQRCANAVNQRKLRAKRQCKD